jgi:hypothetical protein
LAVVGTLGGGTAIVDKEPMIPKPPFPWDLDPEAEIAAFEALKPRLASLWSAIFPGDIEDYTSVVVPSQTLDQAELHKIPGVTFYEERLLFLLIRLRNPRARVVYVTSQPIHPLVLEYYFQLLAGIPASHARARLTLLCAHDSSHRPLTEKILERPRLLQRIRAGIPDVSRAYLSVFNATSLERKLSVLLDIPLNGVDPQLLTHGTEAAGSFRRRALPARRESRVFTVKQTPSEPWLSSRACARAFGGQSSSSTRVFRARAMRFTRIQRVLAPDRRSSARCGA